MDMQSSEKARTISVLGEDIYLEQNEYLIAKNSEKIILRNATLMKLAKDFELPNPSIQFIENARSFSTDKFSYIVLATIEKDNRIYQEIGEANHNNCIDEIPRNYPATIAKIRATSRVLIDALGLQGIVYSEDEFNDKDKVPDKHSNIEVPNLTPSEPKDEEFQEEGCDNIGANTANKTMTKEEAGEIPVTVGYLSKQGKKVKDCNDQNIKWLMGLKSDKFNYLKEALAIYFNL